MSDYYHAYKMDKNGCPKCGGENARSGQYKFRCRDCGFAYP